MAGGGVSAFVEGVRELPRHWCGGRTGWKEAVTRPDPSPAPRPTASATWERNGVLTSLRAEWSCWGSVCCGLSGWMPLSVSASPKRQGLCLLLWLLSRVGKMAQEQLCRYVTISGQKPMDGRTQGHWQVLLLSLAEPKGLVIHLPLVVISPPLRATTLYLVPTLCLAFSWCWGSD